MLLLDNAGWHVAKRLEGTGEHAAASPAPCTPELQPAEWLWPLVREGLASKTFDGLPALEARLQGRLAVMAEGAEQVQAVVGYYRALAL